VQSARGTPPFSGPNGPEGSGEIKKDRGGGSGRRMLRAASLALGWPDNVAANIPHCPSSMAVCPAPLSIMISERFLGHGGCPHARVRACRLRVTGRASNKPISCTVLHVRQCSIRCPSCVDMAPIVIYVRVNRAEISIRSTLSASRMNHKSIGFTDIYIYIYIYIYICFQDTVIMAALTGTMVVQQQRR